MGAGVWVRAYGGDVLDELLGRHARAVDEGLPPNVLEEHGARLEVHQEGGGELVLGARELLWSRGGIDHGTCAAASVSVSREYGTCAAAASAENTARAQQQRRQRQQRTWGVRTRNTSTGQGVSTAASAHAQLPSVVCMGGVCISGYLGGDVV
jgi:hypothetical protein